MATITNSPPIQNTAAPAPAPAPSPAPAPAPAPATNNVTSATSAAPAPAPSPNNTSAPKQAINIKGLNNTPLKPANNSQPNTIISNNKSVSTNLNTNIKKKLDGPQVNNTKKELSINNTIKSYKDKDKEKSKENIKTTTEEAVEYGNVITNNYLLLVAVSIALIVCIVIYFFSASFRVDRAITSTMRYQSFQRITSIDYMKYGESKIGDMYIASAYNAAHSGYQMYDYTSEKMVLAVLQSGARYLEFNVFNSTFGETAYPVVSMGYKVGEWKMMVNDTPLEIIFEIIADNAFQISDGAVGVSNPDDPIFIGLNLNTNSNLSCLNLIAFLIIKYFKGRLLPNEYSYQNNDNVDEIILSQLMGKVVFFASDGFQGSGLEEIINYSWDNIDNNPKHNLQRILYTTIMDPEFDELQLIEYNKKGLTIVVPHKEGDFLNTNFDILKAMDCGCQFVAMEFQYIDSNMDAYITRFKEKSLIDKPIKLKKQKDKSSTRSRKKQK
jgi:hypothetical protein